ncbi:MAG TPA: hypothetical protein DD490_20190 [Acidobacteria bacterium]|nr:hypothetical protein [Acidobacteriota bacterium]
MKKSMWGVCLGLALCLSSPSRAEDLAAVDVGAHAVRWDLQGDFDGAVLTVSLPGGAVIRREVKAGQPVVFELDTAAKDGTYRYELRGTPRLDEATRRELVAARKAGTEREVMQRLQNAGRLPREEPVQSGTFLVQDGALVGPGLEEKPATAADRKVQVITLADQVFADDLIVQGSTCVGFDCVNNESFGFDTIRLKENSTRIKFDDTSVSPFPLNDWQLTANDSASGGANKFSIEDITGAKVPFTVTAGAATNSIFVDSTGRVGFRTATPVLDLHVSTSNTPALRLEQNNSGGFTAQTWDIGGNEANFFVRDVTSGSRLPFRIRPGAPSSSIDISTDGDVGIGTASPDAKLEVESSAASAASVRYTNTNASGFAGGEYFEGATQGLFVGLDNANNLARINAVNSYPLVILTNSTERIRFPAPGGNFITAANGASLSAGGTWTNASSRSYKEGIVGLEAGEALATIKQLDPVKFQYRSEPGEQYVGFIAEDVPALVGMNDHKSLSTMDMVAVLTKVVQEQQKTIEALSAKLDAIEQATRK